MNIEIERVEPDGLRRHVWKFAASIGYSPPACLRLDTWEPQKRASRRHKWQRDGEGYVWRPHGDNWNSHGMRTPAGQVPFPPDVVAEARETLMTRFVTIGAVDPPERCR